MIPPSIVLSDEYHAPGKLEANVKSCHSSNSFAFDQRSCSCGGRLCIAHSISSAASSCRWCIVPLRVSCIRVGMFLGIVHFVFDHGLGRLVNGCRILISLIIVLMVQTIRTVCIL